MRFIAAAVLCSLAGGVHAAASSVSASRVIIAAQAAFEEQLDDAGGGDTAKAPDSGSNINTNTTSQATGADFVGLMPPASGGWVLVTAVVIFISVVTLVFDIAFPFQPWSVTCTKMSALKATNALAVHAFKTQDTAIWGKASATEEKIEEADSSSTDENENYAHLGRWTMLSLIILSSSCVDLYLMMPGTFFQGEASRYGLGAAFGGVYLGGILLPISLVIPAICSHYLQVMHPFDFQRVSISLTAIAAIPMGFGNLIPVSAPFAFGCYELFLRALEGICITGQEMASFTVLLRVFQRKSDFIQAQGLFMSARILVTCASAPLGGLLYSLGGMVLPFTIIGVWMLLSVVLLRFYLRSIAEAVCGDKIHKNTPMWNLMSKPFVALLIAESLVYIVIGSMEVVWQPWLGQFGYGEYNFTPAQVSYVSFTFVGAVAVAAIFGPILGEWIGNLRIVFFSMIFLIAAPIFIGCPLPLFPSIIPSPLLAWLPHAAALSMGLSVGITLCLIAPLLLEVAAEETGLPRAETDGPVTAVITQVILFSISFGALLSGYVIEASGGVGSFALVVGVLIIIVMVTMICLISPWHPRTSKYWGYTQSE